MAEIFYLYINIDPYLAQWFIHECGGETPVQLIRGSIEYIWLETFLQRTPEGYTPRLANENTLKILLPNFRSKDTRKYNFLSEAAERTFIALIRNRFDICMWKELYRFDNLVTRLDEIIYAFMDYHGIEHTETNWNAIAKRYQRKRNIYLTNLKKSSHKKSKKNVQHIGIKKG
jgi:hypothetical protein